MVSEKIKREENNWDERSAGGIVFKRDRDRFLWMLIRTQSKKDVFDYKGRRKKPIFKLPKGHVGKDEFLKQAALREVEEEARVKARIVEKIGSNDYMIWNEVEKKKITKKVSFFLMEYAGESGLRHSDDEGVLGSYWLTFEAASKKLAYKSEKLLLERARRRLEQLIKRGKLGV
jgi:8-oxo-dGTP pyrophosphatase MutT (NUDIX family)